MAPIAEAIAEFVAGAPPGASRGSGGMQGVSMLVNPGAGAYGGGGTVGVEQGRRVTTAWACVRLISQLCGTLPTKVVRREDRHRREVRNEDTRIFWDRPNRAMTGPTFWTQQFMSSLTYGNPYAWKGRAQAIDHQRPWAGISELHPFHPATVKIAKQPETADKLFIIKGDVDARGEQIVRTVDEVAHTPYLSQDGYVGLSPIEDNAAALGIAIQAQRQEATQLRDGLRSPGVLTSTEMIEQADAEAIVKRWMENKTGTNQRPIVLGKGATFTPISIAPKDAELLATLGYFAQDIPLQIYGVPPHMVSIVSKSTSWGSGIEQMFIGFLVTVALPFLIPFEELYGSECLDPDLQLKFTVNNLLRGDMNSRANFYRTLRQMGAMSADTILELEDLPPRGIEDDYLSPQNMTRLLVPGSGKHLPASEHDDVSFASVPGLDVLPEARCHECDALLGMNVTSAELWCVKCKAKRQFGPFASTAIAVSGSGALPRDQQDFWEGVAEAIAERMF